MAEVSWKENKRTRYGSDLTDIDELCAGGPNPGSPEPKRLRIDPDLESPEARRIHDDLLNILDDSDGASERDPAIQGLDLVIKSFEEEIGIPDQPPATLDLWSDLPVAQTELGYLLEASDDELGLPPSFGSPEEGQKPDPAVPPVTSAVEFEINGSSAFENELSNYDSFELGIGTVSDFNSYDNTNDNQFAAVGGFYDYTDDGFDGGDVSELLWRQESLPAI
ncbi:hypothetical protein SAY87_023422 [Trapa incisa]|uniref:Uncharacterized protein n=1 Tax=Trapa incisa TaxID=236973 RepID=A0AAN7L679_9MYRT|nr:hypothetical protein SAY87_023422 [Trapa incisa]